MLNYLRPAIIGLLAVGALVLVALPGDTNAQWVPGTPQFQPTVDVKLCNDLEATFPGPNELGGGGGTCTPDSTAGGHPDITTSFVLPVGHMNYDQGYLVVAGGANETRLDGSQMGGPNPDGTGAAAGGVEMLSTLGLATLPGWDSLPCNATFIPKFIWWEAEYDTADTIACAGEGTSNRWLSMATDGGDAWPGQADRTSPIVTQFPDCTVKLFDPDGDGVDTDGNPATIHDQPVQPRARFAGLTQVPPGGGWQMLQNVEFDPGDLQAAFKANPNTTKHPYAKLPVSLGYINVIVLNDPTAVILQPSSITDWCSPLTLAGMLKGQIDTNNDGVVDTNRVTSPATPGSYQVQLRMQSYRDADGDGIENNFDTCAWTANTEMENPYQSSGPDTDMLDSACDPNPAQINDDQDGDGYENPQDWCPVVANPLPAGETDSENSVPYNTGAPDGGPHQDSIGDDCDSEGGGNDYVSDGLYFNAIHVDSVCITGGAVVDSDSDGWCVNDGDANPYDGDDINDTDAYNPAAAEDGAAPGTCGDGVDNGNDVLTDRWDPDCNPNVKDTGGTYSNRMPDATDPDGDDNSSGLVAYQLADSNQEWCVGTDPLNDCPLISGHDTWPPDFNMDGVSNILDIVQLTPPTFHSAPYPHPSWQLYVTRKDLNCDGVINILDIVQLTPPVFNTSCAP